MISVSFADSGLELDVIVLARQQQNVRKPFDHVEQPVLGATRIKRWGEAGVVEVGGREQGRTIVPGNRLGWAELVFRIGRGGVARMPCQQLHERAVPLRVLLAALIVRRSVPVNVGGVIALGERIDRKVPVATYPDAIARIFLLALEVPVIAVRQFPQPVLERHHRLIKIHKNEILPGRGLDLEQPELWLVEIVELAFVGDPEQVAGVGPGPAVKPAGDGRLAALAAADELVAAVTADIVEAADHPVATADHDQRGIDHRQFADEIAARLRQVGHMTDHQPGFFEDFFPLALKGLGRNLFAQRQDIPEPASVALELGLHECIHGAPPDIPGGIDSHGLRTSVKVTWTGSISTF